MKPLKNQKAVELFLNKHQINLPEKLVQCLSTNNGGRLSMGLFDTNEGKEYVFKSLLSYNEEDLENIYMVYPQLFKGTHFYPIGTTPAGDFVCYDLSEFKYVLLKHETGRIEVIQRNGKG